MVWWIWLALLVGVALAGAIAVAVQRPGRARDVTAWLGAVAFYVVLVAMFGDWARGAHAAGSKLAVAGLGLLFGIFSIGLVVALFKTAHALRSQESRDASATH